MFTMTSVKRNTDGSYSWPDHGDTSEADRKQMVKIGNPSEDIVSGDGNYVRV